MYSFSSDNNYLEDEHACLVAVLSDSSQMQGL